jgi:5-methyltetrahydrofolate--homocysteine methyltransferase
MAPDVQRFQPPFWGPQILDAIPLKAIRPFLDTKSLFRVGWGARGATGEQWARVQAEFEARLDRMWAEADYLHPQAAYGYVPAQSEGDAVVIYDPDALPVLQEAARFCFPRQPSGERLCLADYIAPSGGGVLDVLPLQVVTVGPNATARYASLEASGQSAEAYFVHGLAAQAAEATAAWVHARIRRELGLDTGQGKRYSWGYPPCPDLAGHRTLFALLPAASALGMALTAANQLQPEHSTAALVVHDPEARYFVVRTSTD